MPDQKIRKKIAALRALIDHPNTPPHEVEAARGRLKALEDKYGVQPEPQKTQPRRDYSAWFGVWDDERQESETDRVARRIREQERRYANIKREQERQAKRREAERRWRERHANSDDLGRPLTDEERAKAQKDPLGWAQARDGRTQAQKAQDLQDQFSHKYDRFSHKYDRTTRPKCSKPESFFDVGGDARPRNDGIAVCKRCGNTLGDREGVMLTENGVSWAVCGEKVPGPRRKKPGRG